MDVNEESQGNESAHEEFRRVDTSQTQPSIEYSKKNGASKPLLLVLSLIVLLSIGATGYLLKDKFTSSEEPMSTPSPTGGLEAPITQPSPTPSFDRNKFTLRLLNGTKTSGLAATVSAKLKDLGYIINKTGNATNSAFTKTAVRVKKESSSGLLEQLIKDLSPDYSVEEAVNLKDSDTVDAEVILGDE